MAQAIAARGHAAFSAIIYASLQIEEITALTVDELSFARGSEEIHVAKGNQERTVSVGPRLRCSLRRDLKIRDVLVPADTVSSSPIPDGEGGAMAPALQVGQGGAPEKADVKPHELRRTFGAWYLQENRSQLIELAELMDHSNLSQARKHALSDAKQARAGVAKL